MFSSNPQELKIVKKIKNGQKLGKRPRCFIWSTHCCQSAPIAKFLNSGMRPSPLDSSSLETPALMVGIIDSGTNV